MFSKSWTGIGALALAALLAGCETPTETGGSATETDMAVRAFGGKPEGIEGTRLMAHPMRPSTGNPARESNVVLANRGQLQRTLKGYGNIAGGRLGDIIQEIKDDNVDTTESVPGLTGPGGVYGHALLALAEQAVQGGNYNQGLRYVVDLSGQIVDYGFNPTAGTDPVTGDGWIEAITYVTLLRVTPSGMTLPNPDSIAYKFRVSVAANGFRVIEHTGNDSNPFPGTSLTFGPEMLQRVKTLGFTRKLWAEGNAIKVEDVWIDDSYTPGQPPNFGTPVDKTDPKYKRLFDPDADSCIDMMFNVPAGGSIPENMAELGAPPFYCLGRCANPMLINTR